MPRACTPLNHSRHRPPRSNHLPLKAYLIPPQSAHLCSEHAVYPRKGHRKANEGGFPQMGRRGLGGLLSGQIVTRIWAKGVREPSWASEWSPGQALQALNLKPWRPVSDAFTVDFHIGSRPSQLTFTRRSTFTSDLHIRAGVDSRACARDGATRAADPRTRSPSTFHSQGLVP